MTSMDDESVDVSYSTQSPSSEDLDECDDIDTPTDNTRDQRQYGTSSLVDTTVTSSSFSSFHPSCSICVRRELDPSATSGSDSTNRSGGDCSTCMRSQHNSSSIQQQSTIIASSSKSSSSSTGAATMNGGGSGKCCRPLGPNGDHSVRSESPSPTASAPEQQPTQLDAGDEAVYSMLSLLHYEPADNFWRGIRQGVFRVRRKGAAVDKGVIDSSNSRVPIAKLTNSHIEVALLMELRSTPYRPNNEHLPLLRDDVVAMHGCSSIQPMTYLLVMDHYDWTLASILAASTPSLLPTMMAKTVTYGIASALDYLHGAFICHNAISVDHVLVDCRSMCARLCGLSKCSRFELKDELTASGRDVTALGVLLANILGCRAIIGNANNYGKTSRPVADSTDKSTRNERPKSTKGRHSRELMALLASTQCQRSRYRPTAAQIKHHPWVRSSVASSLDQQKRLLKFLTVVFSSSTVSCRSGRCVPNTSNMMNSHNCLR